MAALLTRDAKTDAFTSVRPKLRPISIEALSAISALRPDSGASRARPADSISSTNGVGAKNPRPIDPRTVQPSGL